MARQEYVCSECESVVTRDKEPEICPSCREDWNGIEFDGVDEIVDEEDIDKPPMWSRPMIGVWVACMVVFVGPLLLQQGIAYAAGTATVLTGFIGVVRSVQVGRRVDKQKKEIAREKIRNEITN